MKRSIHVSCFFAEDVPLEASGSSSLVGILKPVIELPEFPATLPKLGICARLFIPADSPPITEIRGELRGLLSPPPIPPLEIPPEEIQARRNADQEGSIGLSIDIRAVVPAVTVEKPARWEMVFSINGAEYWAGAIRFAEAQPRHPPLGTPGI